MTRKNDIIERMARMSLLEPDSLNSSIEAGNPVAAKERCERKSANAEFKYRARAPGRKG